MGSVLFYKITDQMQLDQLQHAMTWKIWESGKLSGEENLSVRNTNIILILEQYSENNAVILLGCLQKEGH